MQLMLILICFFLFKKHAESTEPNRIELLQIWETSNATNVTEVRSASARLFAGARSTRAAMLPAAAI